MSSDRLVKITLIRNAPMVRGKAMWLVKDDLGRTYRVQVDLVSSSNNAFWAWQSALQPSE